MREYLHYIPKIPSVNKLAFSEKGVKEVKKIFVKKITLGLSAFIFISVIKKSNLYLV